MSDGPYRAIGDLDILVKGNDARQLARALPGLGYEADQRFNAVHGRTRLIFHGQAGKLDVFVETFTMCHELRLGERLALDSPTLTVSDLLMTKLQVVQLNAKDRQDASALLEEHEIADGPGDHIDKAYLTGLVSQDWGLWRTTTITLKRLVEDEPAARNSAAELLDAFVEVPKSLGFRLRARVGDRVQWYELPDDLD